MSNFPKFKKGLSQMPFSVQCWIIVTKLCRKLYHEQFLQFQAFSFLYLTNLGAAHAQAWCTDFSAKVSPRPLICRAINYSLSLCDVVCQWTHKVALEVSWLYFKGLSFTKLRMSDLYSPSFLWTAHILLLILCQLMDICGLDILNLCTWLRIGCW